MGIAKNTKAKRINRLIQLYKKVVPAFPRPCIILLRMFTEYRNGHKKLMDIMKVPAKELSNKKIPRKRPKRKKNNVQRKPSSKAKERLFLMVALSF